LATEPVIVRFPASVLAMASVNHTVCGFENRVTSDFSNITAGTLLTRFDSTAVAMVKTPMRIDRARDQHDGRTDCRDQGRRKARQESDQNQHSHHTSLD
jgi:hypothetical protein